MTAALSRLLRAMSGLAHRDEMGVSVPTSARGGRPEERCPVCDLSILTECAGSNSCAYLQAGQSRR